MKAYSKPIRTERVVVEEQEGVVRGRGSGNTRADPVSAAVGNVRNDGPELVGPLGA